MISFGQGLVKIGNLEAGNYYINPDHVTSINSYPNSSQINTSDGEHFCFKNENLDVDKFAAAMILAQKTGEIVNYKA